MSDTDAQAATRQRLVNAFLREIGHEVHGPTVRVPLQAIDDTLVIELAHVSPFGHHTPTAAIRLDSDSEVLAHDRVVDVLLDELVARHGRAEGRDALARQIANSTQHIARFLARDEPAGPRDARGFTRQAEQSLLRGHPFHPTPKSTEGFDEQDLRRYAPELGAEFRLHFFAVDPELVHAERVARGPWLPSGVEAPPGRVLLPVHPWQADFLVNQPGMQPLLDRGAIAALGPAGSPVYPTSSVRTVCDPASAVTWKLPLHVRITNFIRNNPVEHVRRSADAGRLIAGLRHRWPAELGVLIENGYRMVDPVVVGDLAAETAVLFRENPFPGSRWAPRVVAGLLEPGTGGKEPALAALVRESGADPAAWLRQYASISLRPLLYAFTRDGVSFEAHVQNSLVHTEHGWPTRFWVRDMEGTSASADRADVPQDSPLRYSDDEAWLRLRYHLVTNHFGHLVHVLGTCTDVGEEALWAQLADFLRDHCPGRYAADLLASPTLPAKANLMNRFLGLGERALYVEVGNPLHEVRT
ncbi:MULTISPECIES: IucA/IucC family protein [Prauserella salsuginis group]|uniref:IucA/IucC family protein n=1 Tax=Prauserella salsuginis TaxID=387889 RepID=A0ABW6G8Q5_9PSEU|nr:MULTISPECIES: IucA/IucC family protein [Prauserella salsuginis group]MCR3722611.1 Siderophore synthetase component [Prauserella flava]MCR3737053.1 Siderophore synthetase component [Prauserella salsuginis]